MYKRLKQAIIENNWNFPESEIISWLSATTNNRSGIVKTRHYGTLYFYIIRPWAFCPNGKIELERA